MADDIVEVLRMWEADMSGTAYESIYRAAADELEHLRSDMESLVQAAWTLFLRYAQHHGNCPRRGSNAGDCLCGLSTVNQTVMGMAKKYAPAPPSRPPMGNDYRVRNQYRGFRSDD